MVPPSSAAGVDTLVIPRRLRLRRPLPHDGPLAARRVRPSRRVEVEDGGRTAADARGPSLDPVRERRAVGERGAGRDAVAERGRGRGVLERTVGGPGTRTHTPPLKTSLPRPSCGSPLP